MISSDLNQLLKKNKTASIPLVEPALALSTLAFIVSLFFLLRLSCLRRPHSPTPSPPLYLLFCTIMRASHVEKRDYLRHGIENAARASLSDARLPRFWSGFRFDIVPFRLLLSPSPCSSSLAASAGSLEEGSFFVCPGRVPRSVVEPVRR